MPKEKNRPVVVGYSASLSPPHPDLKRLFTPPEESLAALNRTHRAGPMPDRHGERRACACGEAAVDDGGPTDSLRWLSRRLFSTKDRVFIEQLSPSFPCQCHPIVYRRPLCRSRQAAPRTHRRNQPRRPSILLSRTPPPIRSHTAHRRRQIAAPLAPAPAVGPAARRKSSVTRAGRCVSAAFA